MTSVLVYFLYPYSGNIEKRLVKTPKLYFTDTELAAYLTRWSNPEVLSHGAMAGSFFENFVVMEIVKSYTNAGLNPPLYFYRDSDKKEIDLLIDVDNTIYPIEIKTTANPSKRDIANLKYAENIKGKTIGSKTIICNSDTPSVMEENVIALPYWYI